MQHNEGCRNTLLWRDVLSNAELQSSFTRAVQLVVDPPCFHSELCWHGTKAVFLKLNCFNTLFVDRAGNFGINQPYLDEFEHIVV